MSDEPTPAYVELAAASNFSFLHGASHGCDLVARALALGHAGIGIADRNTVAGVVRAWDALKKAREEWLEETKQPLPPDLAAFKLVTGARLIFAEGTPDIIAYPANRHGWGRLTRLLSKGNLRSDKGGCVLRFEDLLDHLDDLLLIVLPESTRREGEGVARKLEDQTQLPEDSLPPRGGGPGRGARSTGRPVPSACPAGSRGAELLEFPAKTSLRSAPLPSNSPTGREGLSANNIIPFPNAGQSATFTLPRRLAILAAAAPDRVWLGATMGRAGSDRRRIARLARTANRANVPLIAINDALYAAPPDRPLQDVLTCIRLGVTLADAGHMLEANAERHLKSADEMADLFRDHPQAIRETMRFLGRVGFDLEQLRYEYPHEPVPRGWKPLRWLKRLVGRAAGKRWPGGPNAQVLTMLRDEFKLIGRRPELPYYFLTVHDLVKFARAQKPPILCQGRGSAANSMVCYLLDVTAVDPAEHDLLFSRFMSEDRNEPPDIDVDFEHERREEVMQYIYRRYGRHRAGIVATVIHYRSRSAVREVGKALGLTEDVTTRLVSTVWGSFSNRMEEQRFKETGFDIANPEIERLRHFTSLLLEHGEGAGFPRHLSQHVGGYVLTQHRLDETVPVHHGAMKDRTFIEWDKDDIDTLGLMKVDVLALGMLTCLAKAFDLIRTFKEPGQGQGQDYELRTLPTEQTDVYDMLCRGDSIGVFQVESRAQMNMLPRLKPRQLYDLVVQVAIVRPGPIQGDMVHPYLRRRARLEAAEYPSPHPDHGPPDELEQLLGKTFGVPLFQEQAMKLAIVAADFSPADANKLRKAMATFRHVGGMNNFKEKLVKGMAGRGYEEAFAERCYRQIEGFGSYGFPESHALSFALLVYASSFIKQRHPAAFCAALLNSQPMGFYAPAQIVGDARDHGIEVRPPDVLHSDWDNKLERGAGGPAVRLGFRQVDGFKAEWAKRIAEAPPPAPRPGESPAEALARTAGLPARALRLLADADAFRSLGLTRRQALWDVRRAPSDALPLFAAADARELRQEEDARLPLMPESEEVAADYQMTRLSLKGHPMAFLRDLFDREGVTRAADLATLKDGARARVAGVVLVRQRPGKGNAIFVTLEDETGVANLLMWARDFERNRRDVMAARLMVAEGIVQITREKMPTSGGATGEEIAVAHLMTARVHDRTAELARLSEDHTPRPRVLRADAFEHPNYYQQGSGGRRHPRNVRIMPPSRDFH